MVATEVSVLFLMLAALSALVLFPGQPGGAGPGVNSMGNSSHESTPPPTYVVDTGHGDHAGGAHRRAGRIPAGLGMPQGGNG